jgi:hypothetical protein
MSGKHKVDGAKSQTFYHTDAYSRGLTAGLKRYYLRLLFTSSHPVFGYT